MPNAADSRSDARGWMAPALLLVGAVTAFRIILLAANRTDLFVDEAQYWLWGQELAFGYYSKPPLIGWVIRAATELGGSDSQFWVRLPAPLLHAVAGLLLGAIAAPRFGREAALWVSVAYVTLPMVTVGSLMISTDTVMVPFLALALFAWLRSLDRGGTYGMAILAGAALGIGFLAKYAAVYYILCAAIAAGFLWQARPGWGPALAALGAFLVAISPNILWNIANGLSTVEHTLDNADWVRDPGDRASFNLAGLAEFLASQFAVFGPVFFGALMWMAARFRRWDATGRILLLFSLPILVIVSFQALMSGAYANWAATAYVAGTLLVVPWLLGSGRGWLWASLALHVFLAVLLPVATVYGTGWRSAPEGPLLLERYLGRAEMSRAILSAAAEHELDTVVADDRDVLADLFYHAKDGAVAIHARPEAGRPSNHYVLRHAMPPTVEGPVLFVSKRREPKGPCEMKMVGEIAPADGAYARRSQKLFVVDADCLRVMPK